jgi:NADPH-dependent ferric siderophore reductase
MKLPKPVFTERQVGSAWAYDVQLGDSLVVSSPAARSKKKEARSEVIKQYQSG